MERHYITEYPNLVKEWSDDNDIAPDKVTTGSHRRIIWDGSCGHTWEAIVKNRVKGSGCPYCTGNRIEPGINDLATLCPNLASEWSDDNLPLKPTMFACNSNKAVWWKGKCGHEWRARIADRIKGHGCPFCAGKILPGLNDLTTTNPELMVEWSGRNEVNPKRCSKNSVISVWWKCKTCGNEWKAVIATKVKGTQCPFCRHELSRQHYLKMLEERKRERNFKRNKGDIYFKYFAKKLNLSYIQDDNSKIGLSLQYYLPKYCVAIEFTNGYVSKLHRKNEYIKNVLCLKNRIHMIRVLGAGVKEYDNCTCIKLEDDSSEAILEALGYLFEKLGLSVITIGGQDDGEKRLYGFNNCK